MRDARAAPPRFGALPAPELSRRVLLPLLGLVLVAATLVRLHGLADGLWHDEIVTYVVYARPPIWEIVRSFDTENQHLLYSVLAHGSLRFLGDGPWALRLPAVIFGVAGILAVYLLGREVASGVEAVFAAAFLAFSYHHLWFSQNARGYTGLLFWTLLASWLFLKGLRQRRAGPWLLFALATALGTYTHLTMLFVTVAHAAIYLVGSVGPRGRDRPFDWSPLLLGFVPAGVLIVLLYAPSGSQLFHSALAQESDVEPWRRPLWTMFEFFQGAHLGFSGVAGAGIAAAVFAAGLVSFTREGSPVALLLALPTLVGVTVLIAHGHHLWPRFFFFTLGFIALTVVRGAMALGQFAGRALRLPAARGRLIGVGLCLGLVLVSATSLGRAYGPKQDYEGALRFVLANIEPGDTVLTVGMATFAYQALYRLGWASIDTPEALLAIRARAGRTWLVYTFPTQLRARRPELMAAIERDFSVIRRFPGTVREGAIVLCRAEGLSAAGGQPPSTHTRPGHG